MYNIEIPDQIYQKVENNRGRRRIRRLPPVLRDKERSKHNYVPKVISFGPFHHGRAELHLGETFKLKALDTFLSTSGKDKLFFHNTIMAAIDEIRRCYDDAPVNDYDDSTLAEMMLLDGFFIISLMELLADSESLINVLYAVGMAGFSYAIRDMFLLENQVPFIVIKLLLKLRYDDARKREDLLNNFLNYAAFQGHHNNLETTRNDGGDGDDEIEPIHLLEAIRRKLVSKPRNDRKTQKVKEEVYIRTRLYTSRSVTDLKTKGIDFNPSPLSILRDVTFRSHSLFYGNLNLPVRCISEKTKVLFTNLIAYETSPDNANDYAITSYVNLMKSLIHSARDVKELREKRIIVSNLGSDDDVFQLLKDIDTCGVENSGIFHDVKERIEEHYNSKAKTWMAELMHTYFESPWTAMALLAATLLLCLTFLQTYYTIHPSN